MSLAKSEDSTLATLLQEQVARQPDADAILAPGRTALSFAGLWQMVSEVGAALRSLGATEATRVAVVLPNGPEMAVAFLGAASCSTCAPLNPSYRAAELHYHLADIRAQVVIVGAAERGPVRSVALELGLAILEIESEASLSAGQFRLAAPDARGDATIRLPRGRDVALMLHTSGTTARPKRIALSHENLVASARNTARHLMLQPGDRCLNVMPLFHIHGLVGALLASVAGGASIVCTPGYDEHSFFDWIAQFDPTWYTAAPTIHQAIVAQGARYRSKAPAHRFRFVRSASAALPARVFTQLQDLTGAPVIEAYGMTEASHQVASNPLPPGKRKAGSVGVACGVDVALIDETGRRLGPGCAGEIVIRGPGLSGGDPDRSGGDASAFSNGWFRTGDQGWLDAEGYLYILGRLKEIINRGGEKISPAEIDAALLEHPDVVQAVAFAVPHPTLGQDLAAAVVLSDGATADEPGLRRFLFERLADFKVPSAIVFVEALPAGATGKAQRTRLCDELGHRIGKAFVGPGSELERSIEAIFCTVLGCRALGMHDNFFAVGGDSLTGTQVMARINARHGLALPVPTLFRHPTIAALAREVDLARAVAPDASDALAREIADLSDEEVARLLADEAVAG